MVEKDARTKKYNRERIHKNKIRRGTCTELTELVDADRFSYTVLMEYVKGDLGYSEIGGVYINRVPQGWKLVDNDGDLNEYIQTSNGITLVFYLDDVVDKSIEQVSQMQPRVIVRPRTNFFEGNNICS